MIVNEVFSSICIGKKIVLCLAGGKIAETSPVTELHMAVDGRTVAFTQNNCYRLPVNFKPEKPITEGVLFELENKTIRPGECVTMRFHGVRYKTSSVVFVDNGVDKILVETKNSIYIGTLANTQQKGDMVNEVI